MGLRKSILDDSILELRHFANFEKLLILLG